MKFTIRKSEILSILQKAISIVPNRSPLQILTNFFIKIDNNTLTIRATDLDVSITSYYEIDSKGDAKEFVIPAKKLFDICKELPQTDINFELNDTDYLHISTGSDQFKMPVKSAEDFPESPAFTTKAEFKIKGIILDEMSSTVRFAISKDAGRAALKGILCEIDNNIAKMVATDGHKLSLCKYTDKNLKINQKLSMIVPPKAFEQLAKIITNENEEVNLRIGDTYIEFKIGSTILTTKLIDGEYPNYDQAIPKKNQKIAVINRNDLFSTLRRISVMSNSKTRQVKFSFNENNLNISTSDRDFNGEGKSSIGVEYSSENINIGFNADFFIEILRLISSEKIFLKMDSPLSATLILPETNEENKEVLFLIMPLRLLDENND